MLPFLSRICLDQLCENARSNTNSICSNVSSPLILTISSHQTKISNLKREQNLATMIKILTFSNIYFKIFATGSLSKYILSYEIKDYLNRTAIFLEFSNCLFENLVFKKV